MCYYILKDREPIKINSFVPGTKQFADAFDMKNRRIAETTQGEIKVSTVFLVIEHGYSSTGLPLLFETMVFGIDNEERYCERYATYDEALAGHKRACSIFGVEHGE